MSSQHSDKSLEKQYLNKLLQESHQNRSNEQGVVAYINASIIKIQHELQRGNLIIPTQSKAREELSKLKQQKIAKDIQIINQQLNQNAQMFKEAKRELLMQKKLEAEIQKGANEAKIKEVSEKIKHWTEMQKQLKARKEEMEKTKQRLQEQEEERAKREAQEQKEFQRLEKKKQIQQNLKKIEENRSKRDQIIKASHQQIHQLHPKFLQMEQKFRQFEQEIKFQEQIMKKNHKLGMKVDHEAIKAHSKAYLSKMQERRVVKGECAQSDEGSREKSFTHFYSRDEQKIAEEKEKLRRRKQFQSKLKEIPITIDQAKKVKVQIEIDKAKNRIKYNFLGQKALNEFQIYGEFRDFQLNLNGKEIGKQYLRELPQITKGSRITKSNSTSALKQQQSQRTKYKDYLQDLKALRSDHRPTTQQEIQSIIRRHQQKSKAISQLSQRSKRYQLQGRRKMGEAEACNGLQSVMRKSKQADDIYLKSIKAKLACLEMRE